MAELNYNFIAEQALDSNFTFTRSVTAPYNDSNGDAQTAAINTIRFDHTAAGVALGVEINDDVADRDHLTIGSLGSKDYWDEDNGYMIARYRMPAADGDDRYLIQADDGTSSNTIGIRAYRTASEVRANVRQGGSGVHSSSSGFAPPADTWHVGMITWGSGEATVFSDGGSNTQSGTLPTGLTTINIGGRNAQQQPLTGHMARIVIGDSKLTEAQMWAAAFESGDIVVAGGGQSLMRGLFDATDGGGYLGHQNALKAAGSLLPNGNCMFFIDGAEGGSSVTKQAADDAAHTEYWWNEDTDSEGPELEDFYDAVNARSLTVNAVVWKQGWGDWSAMQTGSITKADFKAGMEAIFADMRSTLGNANLPIFISPLGGRNQTVSDAAEAAAQLIRDVHHELIEEQANTYFLCETFDLGLFDQVHLTDAGYGTMGTRVGTRVAHVLGNTASGSTEGPKVGTVSYSGSTITVKLIHDAGTDFTPTSGIEGFTVFDDGTKATINSAVRTDANTITLTMSSALTGRVQVYYGYGTLEGVTQANLVTDNSSEALPLQSINTFAGQLGAGGGDLPRHYIDAL